MIIGKVCETMQYTKTKLCDSISVDGVYTIHYFEYVKDFAYSGEFHNFWELVYADRKALILTAGAKEVRLEAGQLYLHKPNEFHNIRPDNQSIANSIIVSFDCDCPELLAVAGDVISCDSEQKRILGGIIHEASCAFSSPLGSPYTSGIQISPDCQFGSAQMIRIYIEQLLISLIRGGHKPVSARKSESPRLVIEMCEWLQNNTYRQLHFEDILKQFNTSASVVKKLFSEHVGCGAMEYFTRLKIDAAKQMIRENDLNFTEIADRLAFNTSQYFTTVFRRVSGMTPTEYEFSVKANFDKSES